MSRTLLLLDDDLSLTEGYAALLRQRGFTVHLAGKARDAIRILDRDMVDLVVVDGLLPDASGIDFVGVLRERPEPLEVIFLSAFFRDLQSHRRLVNELHVSAVLRKPLSAEELAIHVEACLERTAAPLIAPPPPSLAPLTAPVGEAAFAALRASYAASLPAQLQALGALLEEARGGGAPARERAHLLAHRIHGTAGSYGHLEVSRAARQIEQTLDPARTGAVDWDALLAVLAQPQPAPAQDAVPSFDGPQILVVDDDPDFLRLLEQSARTKLIRVIPARSPAEAMAVVARERIDAALLDVSISSEADGYPLAMDLRRRPGLEALPLGFISANGSLPNRVEAIHAGGSIFLSKPLDLDLFATAVQQLVNGARQARPRALIVDDDPSFLEGIQALLHEEKFETHGLTDPWHFLEEVERSRPDIVLLDAVMPGLSGFELCRIIRSTPGLQELPVLLMTAKTDANYRTAAFEAGADDHLPKPIVRAELLARLRGRLARARLARERADTDPLSNLFLRRSFAERFAARLALARRTKQPLSVTLIDLDHFKRVNDTFGHLAGDRVLAGLGRLVQRSFREEDVRGRWGGEEFVVALTGSTAEQSQPVIARTLEDLRALTFEADDGRPFQVSFSAGVASFPADGEDLQQLISVADRRLYAAKHAGRSRVVAHDGEVRGASSA
jgi:diguanylate cyclase (GGDEF)-like protein